MANITRYGDYITAGDLSANIIGSAVDVSSADRLSFQCNWTGTSPVSAIKLQCSNDGSNWHDISGATVSVSGNTGAGMVQSVSVAFRYVRMLSTFTSGTGTLVAKFNIIDDQ